MQYRVGPGSEGTFKVPGTEQSLELPNKRTNPGRNMNKRQKQKIRFVGGRRQSRSPSVGVNEEDGTLAGMEHPSERGLRNWVRSVG